MLGDQPGYMIRFQRRGTMRARASDPREEVDICVIVSSQVLDMLQHVGNAVTSE